MSEYYTKLDQDIVYSSLWSEDAETCKLWITLLALKDQNGIISKNPVGIAFMARVTLDRCREILEKFCQPDPLSTSPENEGRRLLKIPEGYWVVNHEKYRATGSQEYKKEQGRLRVQRFREKRGLTVSKSPAENPPAVRSSAPIEPEPPKAPEEHYHPHARTVLYFLNEACGKKFRETDANLTIISARLKEKDVTLQGVQEMITRQCAKWKATELQDYLQPSTLFGKSKFDNYYANREQPIINDKPGQFNAQKPVVPVKGSEPVGGF